jgi:hypothetical protein
MVLDRALAESEESARIAGQYVALKQADAKHAAVIAAEREEQEVIAQLDKAAKKVARLERGLKLARSQAQDTHASWSAMRLSRGLPPAHPGHVDARVAVESGAPIRQVAAAYGADPLSWLAPTHLIPEAELTEMMLSEPTDPMGAVRRHVQQLQDAMHPPPVAPPKQGRSGISIAGTAEYTDLATGRPITSNTPWN